MAIIIETCPKCGHDLVDEVICTNPPIPKKSCWNCGWSWIGEREEREEVVRVPFGGNTINTTETKLLNDYLNYSYQESLNNLIVDDLVENFKSNTALNLTNNDVCGSDSVVISGYVQGNTLGL